MEKERLNILNIQVDNITKRELLENFTEGVLITPNVDHLMKLQHDREFYEIYNKADYVTVDSQIVKKAMQFLGSPVKEVITGSGFLPSFYMYHKNNPEVKIYLFGAAPGIADIAMQKINEKVGREIVVGAYSPSFGFEKNEDECERIVDMLNKSDANVLVVGVGAPKQEKWIYKYKDKLKNIKIYLAIGATIDFEAEKVKRAPVIMQKLAIEWLYRLVKEPKRLWRRYIIEDMPFFALIIKQKRGKYQNPFA
ncbi:MAG TPA: WecB/TagA/CpsF family glycosyltransferase [Bacteroidales bacterium]|nr:WecB/TagA/CpsF family glycosyltransferase [Bacteroidales bacterium]HPE55411.1 WecB/TagA/CpsF family glycosyltransferase [Bacteroidales bacterium]HRX96096.1 WecB/TagA/CpsF family glycosyltransferase [Bacteroidales bacterium]